MEGSSRDFLCGIGRGEAQPPEQVPPVQQLREGNEMDEVVELNLELSLGIRVLDRKGDKLPRSLSVPTPVEVPAPPAVPPMSSPPVQAEHAARLLPACGSSTLSLKGDGHRLQGTAVTEEHRASSSVPFSGEGTSSMTAASPPLPSCLAPVTAATLESMGDQSNLDSAAARAPMGDVERRIMQEMPGVYTKDLPNGKRVDGFLYKYKKGEDVKIVCLCHGTFLTPSEFVEHAGAGKVDNPTRHIVVSPTPTHW